MPISLLDGLKDTIPNVIIIRGRVGDVASKTRDGLKEVGACYNSNQLVTAHHWNTFDVVLLHEFHDDLQRCLLTHDQGLWRHHLTDLAALGMDEL